MDLADTVAAVSSRAGRQCSATRARARNWTPTNGSSPVPSPGALDHPDDPDSADALALARSRRQRQVRRLRYEADAPETVRRVPVRCRADRQCGDRLPRFGKPGQGLGHRSEQRLQEPHFRAPGIGLGLYLMTAIGPGLAQRERDGRRAGRCRRAAHPGRPDQDGVAQRLPWSGHGRLRAQRGVGRPDQISHGAVRSGVDPSRTPRAPSARTPRSPVPQCAPPGRSRPRPRPRPVPPPHDRRLSGQGPARRQPGAGQPGRCGTRAPRADPGRRCSATRFIRSSHSLLRSSRTAFATAGPDGRRASGTDSGTRSAACLPIGQPPRLAIMFALPSWPCAFSFFN